jgi:hypothetical protein
MYCPMVYTAQAVMADKAALDALPTRLRAVKEYRAIDRRFCGPKRQRTLSGEEWCAQHIMLERERRSLQRF